MLVLDHTNSTSSPIEFIQGIVSGVTASDDGKRITDVKVRVATDSRSAPDTRSISTTFFVDCSGPTSISAKALPSAGAGWGPYHRNEYRPEVAYSTAIVKVPVAVREKLAQLTPRGELGFSKWDEVNMFDLLFPDSNKCKNQYVIARMENDQSMSFDTMSLYINPYSSFPFIVVMCMCAWGTNTSCHTYLEFIESVHRSHIQSFGIDTPISKRHAWVFEFLDILGEALEAEAVPIEFVHYKMVCFLLSFKFPNSTCLTLMHDRAPAVGLISRARVSHQTSLSLVTLVCVRSSRTSFNLGECFTDAGTYIIIRIKPYLRPRRIQARVRHRHPELNPAEEYNWRVQAIPPRRLFLAVSQRTASGCQGVVRPDSNARLWICSDDTSARRNARVRSLVQALLA